MPNIGNAWYNQLQASSLSILRHKQSNLDQQNLFHYLLHQLVLLHQLRRVSRKKMVKYFLKIENSLPGSVSSSGQNETCESQSEVDDAKIHFIQRLMISIFSKTEKLFNLKLCISVTIKPLYFIV